MDGRARRLLLAAFAVVLAADVAAAHRVGSRFDAPAPPALVFAGAGATVLATAAWLARRGGTVTDHVRPVGTLSARPVRVGRTLLRGAFLLAFGGTLLAGALGTPTPAENPALPFAWALWLKGLGLLAVLVGTPWPTLSPWRTVYDGLCRLEGRELSVRSYPARLGSWPAVVGFVAVVGVAENLTVVPRDPRLTAALFAGYAVAMLLGAVAFGPTWLRRADAFAVLYRLLGRVAPLSRRRREDGGLVVSLRAPWAGCRRPVADGGAAAFVVVAVATVSADGLTGSPEHAAAVEHLRPAVGAYAGPAVFLGLLAVALALWVGTVRSMRTAAPALGPTVADVVRRFAPTVLPIAAAYEVAHNYAYVAGAVGDLVELGTGAAVDPLGWLPLAWFWGSQVALIVGGHVVAVVAAHAVATDGTDSRRAALRGHLPLVALMVAYTVVSLWIVSRPVVRSV
jgi:hypothetical protein